MAGCGTNITPDAVARDWRLTPDACAWPGRTPGLSAAVFGRAAPDRLELSSPCDAATHVLTVELSPCLLEFEIDGRMAHDGPVAEGTVQLVRGGERCVARVGSSWRIIQFYVPAADIRRLAQDMGVAESEARALEILDPRFTPDPLLARLGRGLDRRLARGCVPMRLELDEMALTIGQRLVRRHANVAPPRQASLPRLSMAERKALLDLLDGAPDPGLADISLLLDRPCPEIGRLFAEAFRRAPHAVRAALLKGRRS